MGSAFITLWSQGQVEIERRSDAGGGTLEHAAGKQFRARGVDRGDRIYVLATRQGRLLLIGRMTVERIVGQRLADRHFGKRVYEAPDHLIGPGTTIDLDRVVPESVARRIERVSGKPIKIAPDRYLVEVNSLRTTGRITEESAALLEQVLYGSATVTASDHGDPDGIRITSADDEWGTASGKRNWEHYAFRAWPILSRCATERSVISYGELGAQIGLHHRSIGYVLSPIQDHCLAARLPPLTILIVKQHNRRPGEGFIAWDADDLESGIEQVYS